ncbi:hypothetical protein Tco_0143479 [Tanacetum coccineum]
MKKSKDYCSVNLYAVSIMEDTTYMCLHFTRNHEESKSNTPEQIGLAGDLGSTNDVLIPLDVIENENLFKRVPQTTTNVKGSSTSLIPGPVTTKEKIQKKNDVKARSMLLMTLSNEHLITINWYKDTQTLFVAIQTRFSGNEATKKTQKTLLKQMYENFSAPSTESLDYIFNRLQKILVLLTLSQPNGSQLVYEDLEQIHEDDIEEIDLKWQLALLSMRTRRFFQKTIRKIAINGSDTAGYDKSKVECFNCHKMGYFAREYRGPRNQDSRNKNQDSSKRTVNVEETSSKSMVAIDRAGFDWSYITDEELYKSEFNLATYKRGLASVEEQLVFHKKNDVIFYEQLAILKRDISYKYSEISMLKSELEKLKQEKESNQLKIEKFNNAFKGLDKLIGSQITDNSRKGVGFVSYNDVPPLHTGLFSPPKLDLSNSGLEEFQQPEFQGYGPKTSKNVSEDISNEVKESPVVPLVKELVSNGKLEKKIVSPTKIEFANCNYHQRERMVSGNNYIRVNYNYFAYRNMASRAVLMKTSLRPLNTARPVNIAHSKTTVYSARPMLCFSKSAQSTVKRPYQVRTTLTTKNFSQKVNTAKGRFYTARPKAINTARPKAVNTARPNSAVVNVISKNLMEDMLPLGEEPKEEELLVKELLKLNNVLFTNTGCFILSPDFKLADESQVLLKVPRKNNMYCVDMKNIVPKESLTCLVVKATIDESML